MKINKSSLNEAIYELIDIPNNAAIVDLGCRNAGYLNGIINEFPSKVTKAIGVDVTDRNFGVVPYSTPVELKIMNCAGKLDFPDNTFDLVLTKDLLECISDKTTFVSEINRILKPGGIVICVHADFDSVVFNGENQDLQNKAGWMTLMVGWVEGFMEYLTTLVFLKAVCTFIALLKPNTKKVCLGMSLAKT